MLPVFRGGSYDLPACLGGSGRAVQFLVKEDKTRQTEERGTCHQEAAVSIQCAALWLSDTHTHTHTQTHTAFFPGSLVSTDAQEWRRSSHSALQSGLDRGSARGQMSVPPSRQPSGVQLYAFTPT